MNMQLGYLIITCKNRVPSRKNQYIFSVFMPAPNAGSTSSTPFKKTSRFTFVLSSSIAFERSAKSTSLTRKHEVKSRRYDVTLKKYAVHILTTVCVRTIKDLIKSPDPDWTTSTIPHNIPSVESHANEVCFNHFTISGCSSMSAERHIPWTNCELLRSISTSLTSHLQNLRPHLLQSQKRCPHVIQSTWQSQETT